MARRTKTSPDGRYEVAFGYDRACGWFLQVWDTHLPEEVQEEPVVDLDEFQSGTDLHPDDLRSKMINYGVEVTTREMEALRESVTANPRRREFAIRLPPRMREIAER